MSRAGRRIEHVRRAPAEKTSDRAAECLEECCLPILGSECEGGGGARQCRDGAVEVSVGHRLAPEWRVGGAAGSTWAGARLFPQRRQQNAEPPGDAQASAPQPRSAYFTKYFVPRRCPLVLSFFASMSLMTGSFSSFVGTPMPLPICSIDWPSLAAT